MNLDIFLMILGIALLIGLSPLVGVLLYQYISNREQKKVVGRHVRRHRTRFSRKTYRNARAWSTAMERHYFLDWSEGHAKPDDWYRYLRLTQLIVDRQLRERK